jgi:hypothetical protein
MMEHTEPSKYAYTAPPMNVPTTAYMRSAFVAGITSPYPSVDSVATAQYTDATYNVPLSIPNASSAETSKYPVTQLFSFASVAAMR